MFEVLVWIDLEATGLNPDTDRILEAAVIITDSELNMLSAESIVVHQPDDVLNSMDAWCVKHHGETGLSAQSQNSTHTVEDAERVILYHMDAHMSAGAVKPVMAGNSIHFDRSFIRKHMPLLHDRLHYRLVDVSTIKELARHWYPEVAKLVPGKDKSKHRAMDDIMASIKELKLYREEVFT